jgi:hypothetical protein
MVQLAIRRHRAWVTELELGPTEPLLAGTPTRPTPSTNGQAAWS